MKRFLVLSLSAMAVILMGCRRAPNQYNIEMKPLDDGIERRLTCWQGDASSTNADARLTPFSTNELAELTSLYPQHLTSDGGNRHTFVGRFQSRLPNDVGGCGSFSNIVTSLGSLIIYCERFRGDDDIAAQPEQRLKAIDQLADLITGWLAAELGKEPQFDKLRRYLNEDLRKDLKNLSLYLWMGQLFCDAKTAVMEEMPYRCWQYLVERGYCNTGDLLMFLDNTEPAYEQRWMRFLRRIIGAKMGLTENHLPAAMEFLADGQRARKSLDQYLRTTAAYRERLAKWKEKGTPSSNARSSPPEPGVVIGDAIVAAFGLDWLLYLDHLTVKLAGPAKPMFTNGQWDEATRQVTWKSDLGEKIITRHSLPVLCIAWWVLPNEQAQRLHFDKVPLTNQSLLDYCLWRNSLNKEEAREWEEFLRTLTPGNFKSQLKMFRFSSEIQKPESGKAGRAGSRADFACRLLLWHENEPRVSDRPE